MNAYPAFLSRATQLEQQFARQANVESIEVYPVQDGWTCCLLILDYCWIFFVIQTIKIEENIKNTPDISLLHNIFLIKQSKLKYGIV